MRRVRCAEDAQLAAAWAAAWRNWEDKDVHDQLLAIARQRENYAWLAGQYRPLAERGDEIAKQRLATIQKIVMVTVLTRRPDVEDEPNPFRGVVRMLVVCLVVLGLGFVVASHARRSHAPAHGAAPVRNAERGSAMLVTMIVVLALLSGAAVLSAVSMAGRRGAESSRMSNLALQCADAGLTTARAAAVANYTGWNAALAAGTEPSWFSSLNKDLDGDSVADFTLTLRDNDDDTNPAVDSDLTVFVVSTCTKYSETPIRVTELIRYNGGGNCYQSQIGGCGGNNNAN